MSKRPLENRVIHKTDSGTQEYGLSNTELAEFNGLKIGDSIIWVDETAQNLFSKPAFGYGAGPFKIQKISKDNLSAIFTIDTPKGTVRISAVYFKPLTEN